jgi:hypothetical protein
MADDPASPIRDCSAAFGPQKRALKGSRVGTAIEKEILARDVASLRTTHIGAEVETSPAEDC